MIKKQSKVNRLIIRKNLLKEIKNKKIPKTTPEAVDFIINQTESFLSNILLKAKENMDISARKTLRKEDITEALNQKQEEFDL